MLQQITPIVLSYNEAPNIARTLSALSWATEVLVIDSFSTDSTPQICSEFKNVRFIQRRFTSFSEQCNFALKQDLSTDWVLSMDADYIVSDSLRQELASLAPDSQVSGFDIEFDYVINGHKLRGSLYPARTCLYRHQQAHYRQDGHAHRVVIEGLVSKLSAKLQHDDRKPYSRWLSSQRSYAKQEAAKLALAPWADLSWPDRFRVVGIAPLAVVAHTLFYKGLIVDGWPGLVYTWQRFVAESYLQLARLKLARARSKNSKG